MSLNHDLLKGAKQYIPGGVNSPVRSFKGVDGEPIFIKAAHGPYLIAEDDIRYIDYVGSWGPMILGHAHPSVISAVKDTCSNGLSFGAPTILETQLAEMICTLIPSIDCLRMVNSGTEATMSAIRLARGFSGKNKIIKFNGCYHGHVDSLLVKAGSGALTLGVPDSQGIPKSFTEHTLVADFNDSNSVRQLFEKYKDDIAAVIIEPIAGNMNCILPEQNFLKDIREMCTTNNSILIFDEVMTGFRVGLEGAQGLYEITPDLTTFGKVIGGGMPVGAFGGRRDIMEYIAPLGPVYQAGTLSGNPVAMSAGLATLTEISKPNFFTNLSAITCDFVETINAIAQRHNIPFTTNHMGGMFGLFFSKSAKVKSYTDVMQCDQKAFRYFFHAMLKRGFYFAPSAFEAGFISSAHTGNEISLTLEAIDKTFYEMRKMEQGVT